MPKVYFCSGHLDLTQEEFETYYVPPLRIALKEGAEFVIGDAPGTDRKCQNFLRDLDGVKVTVYHMLEAPRVNLGPFPMVGGFKTDEERDRAMTQASDADIAWVRPGREKSGTAKNLKRRFQINTTKTPDDLIREAVDEARALILAHLYDVDDVTVIAMAELMSRR